MIHPVPLQYRIVTQSYGMRNAIYARTGHHVGTDYATPLKTPIYAPQDGVITYSGDTKGQRGKMVQFKHGDYVLEIRHLSQLVKKGVYTQGEIIGYTGNSGTLVFGYHVCIVVWKKEDGLAKITKENWQNLTVSSEIIYKQ